MSEGILKYPGKEVPELIPFISELRKWKHEMKKWRKWELVEDIGLFFRLRTRFQNAFCILSESLNLAMLINDCGRCCNMKQVDKSIELYFRQATMCRRTWKSLGIIARLKGGGAEVGLSKP